MISLPEYLYNDYHQEYNLLCATRQLKEKYPELTGSWTRDIHKFLELKLKEDNNLKIEHSQVEEETKKPSVIWKTSENQE